MSVYILQLQHIGDFKDQLGVCNYPRSATSGYWRFQRPLGCLYISTLCDLGKLELTKTLGSLYISTFCDLGILEFSKTFQMTINTIVPRQIYLDSSRSPTSPLVMQPKGLWKAPSSSMMCTVLDGTEEDYLSCKSSAQGVKEFEL